MMRLDAEEVMSQYVIVTSPSSWSRLTNQASILFFLQVPPQVPRRFSRLPRSQTFFLLGIALGATSCGTLKRWMGNGTRRESVHSSNFILLSANVLATSSANDKKNFRSRIWLQ
jgi:hypothetical protein